MRAGRSGPGANVRPRSGGHGILFLEVPDWAAGLPRIPFRVELERRKPPVER